MEDFTNVTKFIFIGKHNTVYFYKMLRVLARDLKQV